MDGPTSTFRLMPGKTRQRPNGDVTTEKDKIQMVKLLNAYKD